MPFDKINYISAKYSIAEISQDAAGCQTQRETQQTPAGWTFVIVKNDRRNRQYGQGSQRVRLPCVLRGIENPESDPGIFSI